MKITEKKCYGYFEYAEYFVPLSKNMSYNIQQKFKGEMPVAIAKPYWNSKQETWRLMVMLEHGYVSIPLEDVKNLIKKADDAGEKHE
jgi:hypothetical protein